MLASSTGLASTASASSSWKGRAKGCVWRRGDVAGNWRRASVGGWKAAAAAAERTKEMLAARAADNGATDRWLVEHDEAAGRRALLSQWAAARDDFQAPPLQ